MNHEKYTIADYLRTKNAHVCSLSASGKLLAYQSNEDSDTFQLYTKDLTTGAPGKQVTNYEDGVGPVAFSPVDDDLLIFGKDNKGDEKKQLYLLNLKTEEITPLTNSPEAMYRFGGWSRDGLHISYATNRGNGTDFEIFTFSLKTKEERLVFSRGGSCDSAGFSPDGTYLVASHHNTNTDNDLFLISLKAASEPKLLTKRKDTAYFMFPRWLPNESGFFLGSNKDTDTLSLRFYDLAQEELTEVLPSKWDIEQTALSWDGTQMAIAFNEDGYSRIRFYDVVGHKISEQADHNLPTGEIGGLIWSKDGQNLAFSRCAYNSSYNAWVWDRDKDVAKQVTEAKMSVPADLMVDPELIHYKSFDGLAIPGFLYLPKSGSAPYPTIVYIHGGPEGQYRPGFTSLIQYFVYRGYAVIGPNVRGSDGYGKKYLALDDRDKRLDSVEDLAGLHKWAVADDRINADKIALMGGSYGGYMVLAGLCFQPDLWAAGVDIVGIANLETFLENTSSYRRALREPEYGYLATDREFLRKASPIHKVDDMRAPLFIIHGANDPRVPLSEATQIRDRLAQRGIKAELLVYEDEGHGLAKLKNRLDAYPKVAEFLDSLMM